MTPRANEHDRRRADSEIVWCARARTRVAAWCARARAYAVDRRSLTSLSSSLPDDRHAGSARAGRCSVAHPRRASGGHGPICANEAEYPGITGAAMLPTRPWPSARPDHGATGQEYPSGFAEPCDAAVKFNQRDIDVVVCSREFTDRYETRLIYAFFSFKDRVPDDKVSIERNLERIKVSVAHPLHGAAADVGCRCHEGGMLPPSRIHVRPTSNEASRARCDDACHRARVPAHVPDPCRESLRLESLDRIHTPAAARERELPRPRPVHVHEMRWPAYGLGNTTVHQPFLT